MARGSGAAGTRTARPRAAAAPADPYQADWGETPALDEMIERFEYAATREHPRLMYHATHPNIAAVILADGMAPSTGIDEYAAAVYLFDTLVDAQEWPGESVLCIDTGDLALFVDAYGSFDKYGLAWRSEQPLAADRICPSR